MSYVCMYGLPCVEGEPSVGVEREGQEHCAAVPFMNNTTSSLIP